MRTIAFLTSLNAVGMDQTGKWNSYPYALQICPSYSSNVQWTSNAWFWTTL